MVLFFLPGIRSQPHWQWLGAILVLTGVLLNRFSATLFVQQGPNWTNYIPHWAEWLSTVGILSAGALVWYLGIRYLSVFDSDSHQRFHH